MSWAKLDDQYPDHPKIVEVGPLGMALHVAMICYCARYLTDGFVPTAMIPRLINLDGINLDRNGVSHVVSHKDVTHELTNVGLLEKTNGGFIVHDYLEYNPPSKDVKAERAENARRQAEWRAKRRGKDGRFDSNGGSNNGTNGERTPAPSPSLLIKQIEEMTGGDPLTEAFTKATNITPYDLEKWVQASRDMTNAGVTADEIPITLKKMDDDEMQYSGLWSIVKTAIWVHLRRQSNKPIFSGNGRKGKPSMPDRQPTETWT